MSVKTAHINAEKDQFAKSVLMPGDPLRAKYISENFLEKAELINNVRGVQGHTGLWKGERVSVMASGMGMPSIGIYSWELFNFYDVDKIIRVGSAGAFQESVKLRDIVIAMGTCTDSNYMNNFDIPGTFAPIADYSLLSTAVQKAQEKGFRYHVGNLLSSDCFYSPDYKNGNDIWKRMGVLAVEMEAAALYANAAYSGKSALAICTISDLLYTKSVLSPEERQTGFNEMIELALDTAIA